MAKTPDMSVDLAGVKLRNPIIAAAGTCGYVSECAEVLDLSAIGAVVTKSITRKPRVLYYMWRRRDPSLTVEDEPAGSRSG